MNSYGVRSVTLSILRLDDELSVALTDSRGLATIGKVSVPESELRRLTAAWFEAAGGTSPEASHRAGAEIFDRLYPEAIRLFLVRSPPRPLQLQLAEGLLGLPWEAAFDGQTFIGEKFAVTRQILSQQEFPEARQLRIQGRQLRALGIVDPGEPAGSPLIHHYRAALDAIGRLSFTWVDLRTSTAADFGRMLPDFDVLHCVVCLDAPSPASAMLLDLHDLDAWPPLLIAELECEFAGPSVDQIVRTLPFANQRAGGSCLLRLVGKGLLRPDFSSTLYSELTAGQPLGAAVARARRSSRAALAVLYGDGTQSPFPVTTRVGTDDGHRQVTVMSYDLVNSTRMLASIGAERYSELLAAYHERCAEIVSRRGGTAQDARGDDGIMCYFGFPVAKEGSTEQCILAALEIQGAVRSLEVETRIGIATGDVAVRDNLPHGVPIHMAARLQSIAGPGTVVVSESARNLVRDRFDFELLDSQPSLKGIERPGNVYRVLGARSSGSLQWLETAPSLTPFVGRANELRLLREHWAAAVGGALRMVRISGEAGIGKSRLIREFRSRLASEGANIIECRCAHDNSASALHPIIDFLQRSLQINDRDDVETKLDKIVAAFPRGGRLGDAPAVIARLLSIPFEARFGRLDHSAERLRERTLEVLLAWFQIHVRKRPTCLIVEDANWGDPSSGELLRRLVASAGRLPLLVVLTLRSDAELVWNLSADSSLIELRGLDPESARALVVAASGGARLPKDVVRALAERGDGVPLFIEESTRMALELGTDSHSSLDALRRTVPSTIQDLLMARLDRLGNAKQIAQIGGTIGREFPLTLLAAVVEHERAAPQAEGLLERIRVLTASGMLVEKGSLQYRIYYFKHALVRDAAYNSLWERDRLRLHRAIAEVVAASFPDLAQRQPELLAYHYTEAHQDREALACWELAARHAASRSANYEAIDHLKRGLALLTRVRDESERDRTELRLLLLLAARLIASEGYGADQVESVYNRALELCRSLADDAALIKVQLGLEGYHFMRGDFARAREYAGQAAALAARGSDLVPQLQARWALANIVMHQGDFVTAVEQMDACLKTYEGLTHRPSAVQDPGVMCLCYSAWGLWEMGYPDLALQRAARAVELANALHHSFSMGVAFGFRSTVHHFRGEFDEAGIWAERAIDVCEDAGFVVWLAHAKVMHGRILAERGDPARGVEEMRLGYRMWADTGAVVTQPFYLAMQSEGLALARQFDEALSVVDRALEVVEEHGERYYEAEIRRLRGAFVLQAGGSTAASRRAEAERWFLDALSVAQAQRLASLELRAALSLAQLSAQETAMRTLESAVGKVHGGDSTLDRRRARQALQEQRLGASVGPG